MACSTPIPLAAFLAAVLSCLAASPARSSGEIPEDSVINLEQADHVEYLEKERHITLSGNVRVRFEDNVIQADTIRIDLERNTISAEGNLTWDSNEYHAVGSRMEFNTETREGTVEDMTLNVGPWICRGDRVVQPEREKAVVSPAILTTCDLEHPLTFTPQTGPIGNLFKDPSYES